VASALFQTTLAATCLALAGAAAAQDPICPDTPGAAPLGPALSENLRVYYQDLFADVTRHAPLSIQGQVIDAVQQLESNTLTQAEADSVYAQVASRLVVLRLRWTGGALQVVSLPAFQVTLGLVARRHEGAERPARGTKNWGYENEDLDSR
jgi:hypothetical protein